MDLLIALPTLITLSTIDRINNKNFELYGGSKKKKPKPKPKPKPATKPAAKPPAAKPAAKPTDKPKGDKPPAAKPADKPKEDKPPAAKPPGDKPAAAKPAGDKPAGDKPAGDKPAGDKPAGDKPAGDKPAGASPSPNTGGPSNVSCRAKRRCAHLKPGGPGASGTPGASGDGSGPTNVIYVHKKSWGSSFPSFSGMSGQLSPETTNPVQYILLAVTHIVTSMILYNLMSFLF